MYSDFGLYLVRTRMKFVKRFVFIVIIVIVAFFVYRLISPTAAKSLLSDIKSFSNTTFWTHFALQQVNVVTTWSDNSIATGSVNITGELQEITGADALFVEDDIITGQQTPTTSTWIVEVDTWTTSVSSVSTSTSTTASSSSSHGLSAQDYRDFKTLFAK